MLQRFVCDARTLIVATSLLVAAGIVCESTALGQSSGHGGGGGRHGGGESGQSDSNSKTTSKLPNEPPPLTPHGGEYIATDTNYYEVVYMPLQTRIYLFDSELKPLSARGVHAQMIVQLPLENAPRRIAFQYVAMPAGEPSRTT